MSDSIAKRTIIFLSGAIVGGGISFFVTHRWARKRYLAISDDRVKSLEEYIDRLQAEKLALELCYNGESKDDKIDEDSTVGDPSSNGKKIRNAYIKSYRW